VLKGTETSIINRSTEARGSVE